MGKLYPVVIKVIIVYLLSSLFLIQIFAKDKYKHQNLNTFIPAGFELLDSTSGDLNGDGFFDYVLVLKNIKEKASANVARPLLVLMGAPKGKLELLARNDKAVLCGDCGGVFGDPYQKIAIKNDVLLIEHSVGSSWRWTRIISFKYDLESQELLLYNDESFSFKESSPNRQSGRISNKNDDRLPFIYFAYNQGY